MRTFSFLGSLLFPLVMAACGGQAEEVPVYGGIELDSSRMASGAVALEIRRSGHLVGDPIVVYLDQDHSLSRPLGEGSYDVRVVAGRLELHSFDPHGASQKIDGGWVGVPTEGVAACWKREEDRAGLPLGVGVNVSGYEVSVIPIHTSSHCEWADGTSNVTLSP